MKRLSLNGWVLQVPRPKDEAYLYMPNPAMIHTESSKIRHYLAIADVYIRRGKPNVFEVEPYFDDKYRPDAYMRNPSPVLVEVQRSYISHKKMQDKVDGFVRTYREGKHDAKTLWIVSDDEFKVRWPEGFEVFKLPLTQKEVS